MPGGAVWATLFFFLLFMASLTSTISMSEISIAFFIEEKGMSRLKASALNLSLVLVGGVLCALSFGILSDFTVCGLTIFNLFDYTASNVLLPLGGMLISIFVGWRLDRNVIRHQLVDDNGATKCNSLKIGLMNTIVFLLKWIAPAMIALVFLNSIGLFNIF